MTPKAEALLDAVLVPYEVYGFEEALKPLVAYIEELERKAQAYDATCPHCGSIASGCFCPED